MVPGRARFVHEGRTIFSERPLAPENAPDPSPPGEEG
jgi:hypothetical protein